MASKLGELLLREKIIDSEKLRQAIDYQKRTICR